MSDEPLARRAENSVQRVIEDTLQAHELTYTHHAGAHGGLPGLVVELPGERRLKTNTILTIGEHSVRIEAFVCRQEPLWITGLWPNLASLSIARRK